MLQITVETNRRQRLVIDVDRIEVDATEGSTVGFSGELRGTRALVDHQSTLGALLGEELRQSILCGHTNVLRLYCGPGQELRLLAAPQEPVDEPLELVTLRHGTEVSLDRLSLIEVLSADQLRHLFRFARRTA